MEPRFGLLDFFPSVFTDNRCESLTAIAETNNQLLHYITRSNSNRVMAMLIRALVETQQEHIVDYIEYSGGESWKLLVLLMLIENCVLF